MVRSVSEWESARQDAERIGKFFERLGKAQDVLRTAIAAEQEYQGLAVEIDQARGVLANVQQSIQDAKREHAAADAARVAAQSDHAQAVAAFASELQAMRAETEASIQESEDKAAVRLQHTYEQIDGAQAELARVTAEVDQQEQRLAGIRQQVAAMLQGGA